MASKVSSKNNVGPVINAALKVSDQAKPVVAEVAVPKQVAPKATAVKALSKPRSKSVIAKAPRAKAAAPRKPKTSTVAAVAQLVTPPAVKIATPKAKPAPAALKPETKGVRVMATTVQSKPKAAAEKVNMMMNDFNDRAKAAFAKSSKAGEELTEFTKGNMEALAASAKTAAKGAETMGQEIAEYGKKSFETASATMKSLASVKTPTELFQIQSDYAKSAFDSAVAEASKLSEAWLKLAGEVVQPLSSRYALAAEKIKSAAL